MKRNVLKFAMALSLGLYAVSVSAQTGNVGIGVATPGTKLDVNGAITNRETAIAVAANAATVAANISQVQLTGAATANIAVTATAAPAAGQRLIIYNNTTGGFSATLNGFTIPNGQAVEFAYSNGGYRATNGGLTPGAFWSTLGNAGTNATTNFIGTTDAVDFVTRTNNTEKTRVTTAGSVGIGTNPVQILDIVTQNTSADNIHLTSYGSGPTPTLRLRAAEGSLATPAFLPVAAGPGAALGSWINAAWNGSGFTDLTSIRSYATENQSATAMGANMAFFTTANGTTTTTEKMRIESNGNVGIGTGTPTLAKLQVSGNGGTATGTGAASYFTPGAFLTAVTSNNFSGTIGIYATDNIVSQSGIYAQAGTLTASDNRIKDIKGLSSNSADLATLKKVEITNYTMKDKARFGNKAFKKVIAQQIEQVYPQAITKRAEYIPDVYALSTQVAVTQAGQTTITVAKDHGLKAGDEVKLMTEGGDEVFATVASASGKSFTVNNAGAAQSRYFVYGRKVSDFRAVDYDALSMLNISATQQLAKEVEALKAENAALKAQTAEVAELKTAMAEMRAELSKVVLKKVAGKNVAKK